MHLNKNIILKFCRCASDEAPSSCASRATERIHSKVSLVLKVFVNVTFTDTADFSIFLRISQNRFSVIITDWTLKP